MANLGLKSTTDRPSPNSSSSNRDGYTMRHDNGAEPGRPCPMLTRETQTKCRRLLALPERQLQQVRLNNAIKSNEIDRIVDATMDIKRTYFDDQVEAMPRTHSVVYVDGVVSAPIPEAFKFENLSCLRCSDDNSSEDMNFSASPIKNSLSLICGSQEETESRRCICVKMFKNIMGFMRDRKYTYPETLGRELLEAGLLHPELRDELFLQIIKQLRRNPGEESKFLGYVLLDLCLQSFPPSGELENALEFFLRSEKAVVLVKQLHKIVYVGAVHSIDELPSESEIAESHASAVAAAEKPEKAKNRWSKLRSWAQTDATGAKSSKKVASMNWGQFEVGKIENSESDKEKDDECQRNKGEDSSRRANLVL